MYTIGQCARIANVSTKTLRHYDAIGLFSPAAVGSDNQYRYYSREQIPLLRRIVFLRDLGLGLEVIRSLIAGGALASPQRLIAILEEHAGAIQTEIDRQRARLADVGQAVERVRREADRHPPPERPVIVKLVPRIEAVGLRRAIHVRQMPALESEVRRQLPGPPNGPRINVYYNPEFDPEYVDVEVLFPAPGGDRVLPAATVATVLQVGAGDIGAGYAAVYDWIEEQGQTDTGPPREVLLVGPEAGAPPEDVVFEIQVPVT